MRNHNHIKVSVSLLILLIGMIFLSTLYMWHSSQFRADTVTVLGPQHTEKYLASLKATTSSNVKEFAELVISYNAKSHDSEHQLLLYLVREEENVFFWLTVALGIALVLTSILVYRLFRLLDKSSNPPFKGDAKAQPLNSTLEAVL